MQFPVAAACAVVLSFCNLVHAANRVPAVPVNGQTGVYNFALTCSLNGATSPVLTKISLSGTAPVIGRAGQRMYLTDLTANLTIPAEIRNLARAAKAKSIDTQVFMSLNITNASPSARRIFPSGYWINGTSVSGDRDIHIPTINTVLPAVGPWTLGGAADNSQALLGEVLTRYYFYDSKGRPVGNSHIVDCPTSTPEILLYQINIFPGNGSELPTLKPENGFVPSFPQLASGYKYGCFQFVYTCGADSFSSFAFPATLCAGLPGVVQPNGQQFDLQNLTSTLVAPPDYVSDNITSKYPSARSFTFEVQGYPVVEEVGGESAGYNVQGNVGFYDFNVTIPPPGQSLLLAVPQNGTFDNIGPFSGGNFPPGSAVPSSGFIVPYYISAGIYLYNATGGFVGNEFLLCFAPKRTNGFFDITNFQTFAYVSQCAHEAYLEVVGPEKEDLFADIEAVGSPSPTLPGLRLRSGFSG